MRITDDVTNVLGNSRIDDNRLYLPTGQLDRKLYLAVNKVLEAIGGKWTRKEKAHLFDKPIQDILDEILLTGQYTDAKQEYQFFETPDATLEKRYGTVTLIFWKGSERNRWEAYNGYCGMVA
jgi:hypothetical protein